MFKSLANIFKSPEQHYEDQKNEIGSALANKHSNNKHAIFTVAVLMRGVDKLIFNGLNSIIVTDLKKIDKATILQLLDLYSGFMRSYARSESPKAFDVIDRLAVTLFPTASPESLRLFDDDSDAVNHIRMGTFGLNTDWEIKCQVYAWTALHICPSGSKINKDALRNFLFTSQSDVDDEVMMIYKY